MLYTVEREVPETAAAMRLSSMELSDAIEEVTLLGYIYNPDTPPGFLPCLDPSEHITTLDAQETAAPTTCTAVLPFSAFMLDLLCSNDLSQGVRSSAAAVTAAEQGVRQGAQYLKLAIKEGVIPSVKTKVPGAKGNLSNLCVNIAAASLDLSCHTSS